MTFDSERLARVEERVEALGKRLDRLEDALSTQIDKLEQTLKQTINGRLETLEAKDSIVRAIVFGFCVIVLTAFAGAVVAWFIGIPIRHVPTLPQPHTLFPR